MMSSSHVHTSIVNELNLSPKERIKSIRRSGWIGYPRADEILQKLDDLLTYPKTHRMPNLLIAGETNNGKTMLIQHFCSRYKPSDNLEGDSRLFPVFDIQAPPAPVEGRFYNIILERFNAPFRHNDRVDRKLSQVINLMQYTNVKILIIDEIHHLLAGTLNKQRTLLNTIKYLGNELKIPIVAVGTHDAFRAIQTDPQLANRFEVEVLQKWDFDEEYVNLLLSFIKVYPLKKESDLLKPDILHLIYTKTEGYIGEISRLMSEAAVQAIRTGSEKIDMKIIKSLRWVPPSDRKHYIDFV